MDKGGSKIMSLISIVVPCYNEEEVLPLFYAEITKISAQMTDKHPNLRFEYLFIDDGSKDQQGLDPFKKGMEAFV